MRRTRRTGVLAIAASLALTAGAVTAVLPASAGTPGEQQDGTLAITTSLTGPGEVTLPGFNAQTLDTTGACDLKDPVSQSNLIQMRGYLGSATIANAKTVGFRDGSIGVNEKVESLCNKVDNQSFGAFNLPKTVPEILELSLGDSLKNFEGNVMSATSASLDMELRTSGYRKEPALVEATLWNTRGLTTPVPVGSNAFFLAQGNKPTTPAANTEYAGVANDENYQWKITPSDPSLRFDTIRLRAVKGDFSLEGGSDANTDVKSAPSTFTLVSDVSNLVECDNAAAVEDGDNSVAFVGNADGSECTDFGVTLEGTDREVTFLKSLTLNPESQFIFDIEWKLERPETPAFSIAEATIDFEFKDDERPAEEQLNEMPFCPDYLYSSSGELTGLTKPAAGEDATDYKAALADLALKDMVEESDAPSAVGTQFACIADSRTTEFTNENLIVNDKIYLIGDAKMRL